ncbi:MAG: 3-oxoacyl-[acyl-carrier-protein] synthase III C-terminal domain-containing protein, partial [Planctomycetota bacterium]
APAFPDPRTLKLLRRVVRLTAIDTRYSAALDFQQPADGRPPLYLPAVEQPHGPGMGARGVAFNEAAGPLVLEALRVFPPRLLARVDTLITASCTHASAPGLERPILTRTPVPAAAHRWNLGFMGCSAALAGLRMIGRMPANGGQNGDGGVALVVACELSSLHFQYSTELDQLTANVLFADGAAAIVLAPEPSAVRLMDARCISAPEQADQMVWFADDHGLRLQLAPELPETLAAYLPAAVESFLGDNGLRRSDVDHWLVHPGGPQILDRVEGCLELAAGTLELSRSVLRRYGNMSSPTILFIFRELIERRVDGLCVALAFGPGLTIEMALFELRRA